MISDGELLKVYATQRSEGAFAELVGRYVDLVYSAALRQVNGDAHLAQDVTQSVFSDLARKAGSLGERPVIAGWLFTSTHFAAAKVVRGEQRRQRREEEAEIMRRTLAETQPEPDWEKLRPILDGAMMELNEADREAVLLRYFQNRAHGEIATRLGLSENAARMRVERALDKLREALGRRGLTTTASLASVVVARAVETAPVNLTALVTGSAVAGAAAVPVVVTAGKAMMMTTIQKIAVVSLVAISAGAGIYQAHQASVARAANELLVAERAREGEETKRLTEELNAKSAELEQQTKDQSDLLKLRAQATEARADKQELARLRNEKAVLVKQLEKAGRAVAEDAQQAQRDQEMAVAKLSDARTFSLGLIMFADDHDGRFPAKLEAVTNYVGKGSSSSPLTNNFDLLYSGKTTALANPSETILLKESQPWLASGKWHKTYAFADGHSEMKVEPAEGFEARERQHIFTGTGEENAVKGGL